MIFRRMTTAGEQISIPCFDGLAGVSMTIHHYVVVGVVYHIGARTQGWPIHICSEGAYV